MLTLYKTQGHSRQRVTLRRSLCGEWATITVNSKLEQVKIEGIGGKASWVSIPQSSDSREDTGRIKFTSHQRNTKGMKVVFYNVRGIVDTSR